MVESLSSEIKAGAVSSIQTEVLISMQNSHKFFIDIYCAEHQAILLWSISLFMIFITLLNKKCMQCYLDFFFVLLLLLFIKRFLIYRLLNCQALLRFSLPLLEGEIFLYLHGGVATEPAAPG